MFMTIWLGHNKELIFGDLNLIFKVTAVDKPKIDNEGTSVSSENTVTNYNCISSIQRVNITFFEDMICLFRANENS